MAVLLDPRRGDAEDDASSTKQRSLFAIAGSLLAELSLPKLLFSWLLLIALPGVLLGLAPLVVSAWASTFSAAFAPEIGWLSLLVTLVLAIAVGAFGGRRLFRMAEQAFWSLNSLAVQPGYALTRELIRHLMEAIAGRHIDAARRARLSAVSAALAGVIVCAVAAIAIALAWPHTRWVGSIAYLTSPLLLILPALANTVVVLGGYLAAAALLWGVADAAMEQPADVVAFDGPSEGSRVWRIAHLSDIHVVGERYGFRIESGRSGPRGNDRLDRAFDRLETAHAEEPLDLVLISGDMTDAGRSTEWAEFLSALANHPALAQRTLVLPGNHDIGIVDRANPARVDLPGSPRKRLRQMRALAVMAGVQGDRTFVVDNASERIGETLSEMLAPHREAIASFADTGSLRLSMQLGHIWGDAFPLVLPPDRPDGLGAILLNSVAETHFSFTNALGLVSAEQSRKLLAAARQFPDASWLVALHHHLVEYPRPVKQLSERVGTALINGSWFVRQVKALGNRIVVMHGHRHIDWIGDCGGVRILSAPSPVMNAANGEPTYFYIHRLAAGPGGRLNLLSPVRVDVPPEASRET